MINNFILQNDYGDPNQVLSMKSSKILPLKNKLDRIKILARPINPSDILSIKGYGQYIYNHKPPRIPGFEGVGKIINYLLTKKS